MEIEIHSGESRYHKTHAQPFFITDSEHSDYPGT